MDPGVLVMLIPIAAIFCGTYIAVERMKSKRMTSGGDVRERLDQLEHEMEGVREELASTQERLDFAERMLAKQKDAGRLAGGA